MKKLVLYIHGKGGSAAESAYYKKLFPACDVRGFAYQSQTPWDAKAEFTAFFDAQSSGYDSVILIANSIGAFFALSSLAEKQIAQTFLISPIIDMEHLICTMLHQANRSEKELQEQREILTDCGETISWAYLCYVREHPLQWNSPTCILYGEQDDLTSYETISAYSAKIGATLTVMPGGAHWFHTEEQLRFLENWIRNALQ